MSAIQDFPRGEVRCTYHPDVMTGLRCSRCGKPICPRCGVRTPVGLRCPDCAGVRGLPTYATGSDLLLKAAAVGLVVGVGVAILWAYAPAWKFYLSLLLGFGVAEGMAWASRNKRGVDLQVVGFACITAGLILSRILLAERLNISWQMLNEFFDFYQDDMQLTIIPDGVFAALAYLIVWVRFR
jgi:hypothetical protein